MPRRSVSLCLIALLTLLLAACAHTPAEQAEMETNNDPLETFNRRVFDDNSFVDRLLMRPLAELYRATVPPGIRDRVAGILSNMREPVILVNNVMQGDFDRAGTTIERFGINTTIGIGGMWDWAGQWGMYQQPGDFGQTLAVWGAGEGPYMMLPVFGPSNVRDAVGRGVDIALSPWQYLTLMGGMDTFIRYETTSFTTDVLVRREKNIETIDAIRAGSLDTYAEVRSAYRQHRRKQLGQPAEKLPEIEDYQ